MMPLEHCPLPWVVRERDGDPGWYEIDHDGNGSLDCRLSKEDAEFIVRACNAHDDLVEALKSMVEYSPFFDGGQPCDSGLGAYVMAKSAIEKAEG